MSHDTTAKLILNVCPIEVADVEIPIGVLKNGESREMLQELRQTNGTDLVFRLESDLNGAGPAIISAATRVDVPLLGYSSMLSLRENPKFAAVLARSSLVSHLTGTGRKVFGFHPVEFTSTTADKNLLNDLGNIPPPQWLSVRQLISANVAVVNFRNGRTFLGISFDMRIRRFVELPCDELIQLGLDLRGLYVSMRQKHYDCRISQEPKLIGRVVDIKNGKLLLADGRDGVESVDCREAYVERREGFERVVDQVYGGDSMSVRYHLGEKIHELQTGANLLKTLDATQRYFSRQQIEIAPGIPMFIRPMLSSDDKDFFPSVRVVPQPKFLFDSSGRQIADSGLKGIRQFGPYSRHTFDRNHLQICVICQAKKKGLFEKFLHAFLEGIKLQGNSAYQNGFISEFKLSDAKVTFFCPNDDTAAEYARASNDAIQYAGDKRIRWDIAFVQIDDEFRDRLSDANPYLISKKAFLTHQIPVQAIRSSTAAKQDKALSYVMNNVALALYAKLDGTPWLLQSSPTVTHELVFGLGSSYVSNVSKLDTRERVVGITTVFQSDGSYFLSDVTKAAPIENFCEVLLDALRRSFEQVIQPAPRSSVRLVFHAFKPLKNSEVDAVKSLVAEKCDFETEFAFIHVVDEPQYRLFDTAQTGWTSFENSIRGEYAPARGRYLEISDYETLLVTTGPSELRRSSDGLPSPILLRLHRDSTFCDMTYLTRQVFHFTAHSWQTVSPTSLPVTIHYSHLIAKKLGQLSTLSKWDSDIMLGRIGRTRWFL
ncbi:MAG TPA: Piwi domain-containing protein [Pirellulaceae bacterium]|mgnify:CR=1 FL=1|nr:Piwi domain-containing protein [Pirellulaceae bacterium]